jgi:hypothetical protein
VVKSGVDIAAPSGFPGMEVSYHILPAHATDDGPARAVAFGSV